jgi:hypothetical protein
LQGQIQFINPEKEVVRVKSLALVDKKKKRIKNNGNDFIRLSFRLNPGENKFKTINHQMPSATPPGTYENYIAVGNKMHKVKMIVQPTIAIETYPNHFTFQDSSPGTKHTAIITLTNSGNIPFQIPQLKHASILDMDLLCRAFGFAFRKNENDDLTSTINEVVKNIKLNMVDWISISVDEFNQIIQPNESVLLHVHFILPKNANPKRDYSGNFRFWDKDIAIVIKSHIENKKNIRHGKLKK